MNDLSNLPSDEDLVDLIAAEEDRAENIEAKVATDAGTAPAVPALRDEDLVDLFVENERRAEEIETGYAAAQNAKIDPTQQARAIQIAEREGLPVDVVRRNLDQFEEKPTVDPKQTPSLAKLSATPYGAVSQFDIETMGYLERVIRSYGQAFQGGIEGLESSDIGYKRMQGAATPEDLARLDELRAEQKKQLDYQIGSVAEFFQYPVASAPAFGATLFRTWDEVLLGAGTGAATAAVAGQLGPQAALPEELLTVPGAALAGAGIGARAGFVKESYQQLAGDAYNEALEALDENGKPLDDDTAYSIATFAGGIGAVAELLPFEKALDTMPFLKGVVGKEGAKRLARYATQNPAARSSLSRMGRILKLGGAEAFTEVLQEALVLESIIASGGVTDEQGKKLADQRLDRYGEAAVGGFAGGSTLGAGGEAVTATVEKVSSVRQKRAEEKQKSLIELGDKIRGSKINGLSPETIVAHAKQIDADGAGPRMSAPAEALFKLFQSEGLTQEQIEAQFPTISRAMSEAVEGNAEVPLNAEMITRLARLEKFSSITGDIRTGPNELTVNESKAAMQAEFDAFTKGVSDQDQKEAVRASIEAQLTKQLTAAGQEPRAAQVQARLWSSILTNIDERNVKDPGATLARYRLDITNNMSTDTVALPDATVLAQEFGVDPVQMAAELRAAGGDITQMPTFRNWFGDSKVVDESGKPVVVYHGSEKAGFTVFNTEGGSGKTRGTGAFFSNKLGNAFTYSGSPKLTTFASDADTTVGDQPSNVPVFLKIQNPLVIDARGQNWSNVDGRSTDDIVREARESGQYDGVIFRNLVDEGQFGWDDIPSDVYAVFDPTQIKSVQNRGAFDPNNPNILRQSAAPKAPTAQDLIMVAKRGERAVAKKAEITPKEEPRITAAAEFSGLSEDEIRDQIIKHKRAHPEKQGWAPLVFKKIRKDEASDGTFKLMYEYDEVPYAFNTLGDGKSLEPGTPDYKKRVKAIGKGMAEEVRSILRRARAGDKNAQNILAQAGWYKAMRSRLRQEFGGLGDLFADLLGATSPNTPVRENWKNAVDSLRRASRGDFDNLIGAWVDWADKVNALELEFKAFVNQKLEEFEALKADRDQRQEAAVARRGEARKLYKEEQRALGRAVPDIVKDDAYKAIGADEIAALRQEASEYTKKALFNSPEWGQRLEALQAARKGIEDLLPTKETGSKYGFNGRNVANAMINLWRVVKNEDPDIKRGGTKPKAINFSGNLIGFRNRATIDVWAARMLQRLAGFLRIPSMAEGGVSGDMREDGTTTLQFGFGQDVFGDAVQRIRQDPEMNQDPTLAAINDDDLQAVVWFIEKELWTVNGWTSVAGEGGSFELEANLTGPKDQARINQLRRIIDSSAEINKQQKIIDDQTEIKKQQRILDSKKASDADKVKAAAAIAKVEEKKEKARQKLIEVEAEKEAARQELAASERTVDRFVGGLSIQMSKDTQGVDFVPTDADMEQLGNRIRTAIYESDNGATVLASKSLSTEGRYGRVERSLDLEVVAREGYDPKALWLRMLQDAQQFQQDSTFLSRVLREGEAVDYTRHRPGVEIYFQDAAAQQQLEQVLADLAKEGVEFLTVIVDGRRMPGNTEGAMPPAVGVRLQYAPEFEQRYGMDDFSGLDDADLAAKIAAKGKELRDLADRVAAGVPGVSFAGRFWYETEVAFASAYQEKIDALTAGDPQAGREGTGGSGWAGEPIAQGIANADRHVRETASGEPGGQPGDLLGGDAEQVTPATDQNAGGPQAGPSSSGETTLLQTSQSTQTTARGFIKFGPSREHFQITLTGKADLSTFNHEMMHYALEVIQDLVQRGEASPQLVADLQKLRDFAGLQEGQPIERRHHEQIARAWEAYTMEGRAPSADLQGVFNRMRAWLVFIYKRLSALDVELTDEVRGVFDRLVASDEQIAEARANIGWNKPLPKEALFLSDDEYDRYVEAHAKASEAQQREVDAKLMLEAARETQAAWKEERAKVFEEEKAKLAETRGHRHWKLLTEGEGLDGEAPGRTSLKIDPESVPAEWRRDTTGMTDEMGLPLEAVAEILGYDSGEQMLSVIAGAKMADRDLPRQVQRIMAERHGDMDAVALAEAAMAAVHSDQTQEVALTEFRAMAQKAGIGAPPPGLTKWLAAQAQQKVLGLTRRQLDPMRWRRAELKAATDSAKAAAKGDMTKAAIHKRQQLMAAAMYRATVQADKRVDVIRKKLMPFTKNDRRAKLGKAGGLYLDGIDEILEGIQLKPMSMASITKLDRLQKLVEEADKSGEPLVLPDKLRAMLGKKNFADMTLEELEGVHDAVMNIWHLAKLKNELRFRQEKRDMEEALTEMEANAAAALGDPKITDKFVYGWKDRATTRLKELRAGLVKMEFLFSWLDGKPDGGLMHKLIYQPIADANKAKFVIMKRFHKSIIQHMRNLPADQKARWEAKRTFLGRDANGATVISAALNLGNEGNKSKLLKGYGLDNPQGQAQLMAEINAFMTKADWDFVQHVWNEIDTLWPEIEKTTKAATGLPPERVVPTPVVTPFGTYAGGYYPVVYDPAPRPGVDAKKTLKQFERQQSGEGLFSTNFVRPTLGDGFTKARTDFENPPILLDLKVISQHLAEVVHFVTHYEAITQADKITRHPRFIKLVQGTMGDEFYKNIRPWLIDIARDQDTPAVTKTEPYAKAMRYLRGGLSIGAMGYNIFTGLKQLLGVTTALDAVKPKYLLSGLQKAWASPNVISHWKTAFAQSGELEPLVTQFDRDIKMINDVYAKQGIRSKFDKFNAMAFAHIGWLQASVNVATWYGAKEQAIAEGLTEQQAIDRADAVVRMTQSAGAVKDLSPIQRGSEINRNVSMFYSWFNVLYNRMEDIQKQTKGVKDLPKAAKRVAILIMMTALVEETASRAYEAIVDNVDDDDEEAGFILTVLMKSADTALAAIPLVRAFISVEAAAGGMKPEISPVVRVGADYWRTFEAIKDLVLEQEAPSRSEMKTAVRTTSVLTHVPVSGLYNLFDEYFGEAIFGERRKAY
jgi:hypothetical protein